MHYVILKGIKSSPVFDGGFYAGAICGKDYDLYMSSQASVQGKVTNMSAFQILDLDDCIVSLHSLAAAPLRAGVDSYIMYQTFM